MGKQHKINQYESQDPGLGTAYQKSVKRILNEDGSYNIKRVGTIRMMKDFYKYLVDLNAWKFGFFLVGSFLVANLLFAGIYCLIGTEYLHGINPDQNEFVAAYYFSAQTFTTVGYGAIAPRGNLTSFVAAMEAFVGLIAFAIATGLIYGRFSRPSTKIAFSHNVIITPHKDQMALMFKIVNQRNSVLLNTKVHVLLSLVNEDSVTNMVTRQYYNIPLETDFVRYFPLTWTLVHLINEDSPLYDLSLSEIREKLAELLIIIEAFDETYSQTVIRKHSYAEHQWATGVKFKKNFSADDSGTIILNINEISDLEILS
ncbi:MAG: Ion transport 2 domain protein [Fluviicola sp.]|jgi:inward rectifier potassium channel|uniref:ion channel n=1 Tax=Fluviicola sp. TaxID=1917219 RepID=UPI0026375F66|nr:ion channel [Fluviicola sp.]MDF3025930.1 Ion transport 2 domain protein [Fluviicola sp.]